MNEKAKYQLSAAEQALMNEYEAAIVSVRAQAEGAFKLILRQQGLNGNYRLENGMVIEAD